VGYGSKEKAILNNIVSDSDYFYSGVKFPLPEMLPGKLQQERQP
jgi:hypothetical protein